MAPNGGVERKDGEGLRVAVTQANRPPASWPGVSPRAGENNRRKNSEDTDENTARCAGRTMFFSDHVFSSYHAFRRRIGTRELATPQHAPDGEKCDRGMGQKSVSPPRRPQRAIQSALNRAVFPVLGSGGSKTMVRVGGAYDRIGIQQALDLGSDAILIPCSRTAEDVKHAVSCGQVCVRHHLLHLALALGHRDQRRHQVRRPLLPDLARARP